jgi:hypothetical protein
MVQLDKSQEQTEGNYADHTGKCNLYPALTTTFMGYPLDDLFELVFNCRVSHGLATSVLAGFSRAGRGGNCMPAVLQRYSRLPAQFRQ